MDWEENSAVLFGMKGCPATDNFYGHVYLFLDVARTSYHDFVCIGSKPVVTEDMLIYCSANCYNSNSQNLYDGF